MDLYALFEFQVSVQAFNDEDPQGRRTLGNVHGNIFFKIICPIRTSITRDKYLISGLFLHRRKAEITDSYRKVSLSLDKMKLDYVFICFCVSAPFYFHIFDRKVSNYYLLSCWYYWLIFSGSYVCGFSWKGYCSLSGKSKFLYIYTNPKGTCCDFAFLCLLLVDMPIKERSHGVWELQTEGHSFTEGSKGMGLAHSSVVWWACWYSPKWDLESGCCRAARVIFIQGNFPSLTWTVIN